MSQKVKICSILQYTQIWVNAVQLRSSVLQCSWEKSRVERNSVELSWSPAASKNISFSFQCCIKISEFSPRCSLLSRGQWVHLQMAFIGGQREEKKRVEGNRIGECIALQVSLFQPASTLWVHSWSIIITITREYNSLPPQLTYFLTAVSEVGAKPAVSYASFHSITQLANSTARAMRMVFAVWGHRQVCLV